MNGQEHYKNRLVKLLTHLKSIEIKKIRGDGQERHHIVPESWRKEWIKEKDNLLLCSSKAHYVIHHLLWKSFPHDKMMVKAFFLMSHKMKLYKVSAREFAKLRNEFSQQVSEESKRRVLEGNHNLLSGEIQRKNAIKRIENGTHNLLGPENNRKRVLDGTHPFLGRRTCKEKN